MPLIPQEAAAEPVVVDEQVAAVPEIAAEEVAAMPDIVAEQMVDAEYEDEASASNVSADADNLMPLLPEFTVPPMEWLLGGPNAGWLVYDPERDFGDEELPAPPPASFPTMYYCPLHGYGPRLPFSSPLTAVDMETLPSGFVINLLPKVKTEEIETAAPTPALPALPDHNLPAPDVEEKEHQEAAPQSALPTPSPEARVLLRRFASAVAARPTGIRIGTWSRGRHPIPLLLCGGATAPLKEPALSAGLKQSSNERLWSGCVIWDVPYPLPPRFLLHASAVPTEPWATPHDQTGHVYYHSGCVVLIYSRLY
ncbi:uncharacterized protein [Triticum aestivum]|uniref:uncharacterized protein n=1 Tax=Triticum aestivum TaxID=4565 RepID=UPI001D00A2D0|nr:uncharacterized protein LOC123186539 [Triticum aestivum]